MIDANQITKSEAELKQLIASYLKEYLTPSFGSAQKRDLDVATFCLLQDLGFISMNPQNYEIVTKLHVTTAKARNLIYGSSLRRNVNPATLDGKLKEALSQFIFLETGDKMIGLEIDDPLLIDHLKNKLRELHHITDGSFNIGLIKMTVEAYESLLEIYVEAENLNAILPDLTDEELEKFGAVAGDEAPVKRKKLLVGLFNEMGELAKKSEMKYLLSQIHTKVAGVLSQDNVLDRVNDFKQWIIEHFNEIFS